MIWNRFRDLYMKIVNLTSQLPLPAAPEPVPPREPGKLTAAAPSPYDTHSGHLTSSVREVKSRPSFAGGFQFPKRAAMSPGRIPVSEDVNSRLPGLEPAGQFSGNMLDSLESQLAQLRKESEYLKSHKPPEMMESLLHLDPPAVYHSHHSHNPETAYPQSMSLAKLEQLRSENERKLTESEAEYLRTKSALNATPQWTSDDLNYHGKRMNLYSYADREERPKIPTETRVKYEKKFEGYLERKKYEESKGKLQGNAVQEEKLGKIRPELEPFLSYIFKKIDKDGTGQIDKVELMQELHQNPELATLLGFQAASMDSDYMHQFEQMFSALGHGDDVSYMEFMQFFMNRTEEGNKKETMKKEMGKEGKKSPKRKLSPRKEQRSLSPRTVSPHHTLSMVKSTSQSQLDKPLLPSTTICMLTDKQIALLEDLFRLLDVHEDMTVKVRDYMDLLRNNERIQKIMHTNAVRLTAQQVLNLETMLEYIETDVEDEYVTWQQFLAYFHTRPILVPTENSGFVREDPRLDEVDLPDKYMDMVARLFQELPHPTVDKVSTYAFVEAMKKDPQVKGILSMTAREPSGLSAIPMESVGEVLRRMEDEASSLITWNDILGFFSKRGRPETSDGYMSDPELQTRSKPLLTLQNPKPRPKDFSCQTEDFTIKPAVQSEKGLSRSFSEDRRTTKKFNITVPQPFTFDERELTRPKTRAQKQFEEMVAAKHIEEERFRHYRYKARPVPSAVTIPKYESLMAAQEARRLEVKRTSIARTKAAEKPFSFYLRDQARVKPSPAPKPQYQFKANPIPWAVAVPLFDQMNREQKARREEQVAKLAQESLRKAHLPPRMEMHEKTKVVKEPEKVAAFHYHANKVPNFGKLQQAFQRTLDAKKHNTLPTEPKPFHFHETKSSTHRNYLNDPQQAQDQWGMRPISAPVDTKPTVEPRETQKLKDMIQLKKKQLLEREEKQRKIEGENKERLDRSLAMQPRVQNSQAIQSKNAQLRKEREDRLAASLAKSKVRDQQYQESLRAMKERVSTRPLLVESVGDKASAHTARLKALLQFRDRLKEQGLKPESLLTGEEKELVEEADYLRSRGQLS